MAEKKKKNGNTVGIVEKLAIPIAEKLGLTIWDIRFVKEGTYWYLRIFIDKPAGITLEDCEAMSRGINEPLDELDPISQEYCLEVCSPGIDRELTRPHHFQAFINQVVSVKLIRPLENGEREVLGILNECKENVLLIETQEGAFLNIPLKDTASVRVCDEYVDVDDEILEEEIEEHE